MADSSMRKGSHIPKDLLNDLSSRFIINVPEEERADLTRLCFQIELAHWFYLDFYREKNPKLPKCNVKEFIHIIFRHIPFLQSYYQDIDSVIANWREYKSVVPAYGAILLDKDLRSVLLVQSFYSKASWGFPKGKVNEEETPHHCAIREVLEETGFDITDFIDKDAYLEHHFNGQLNRLYIIPGVPKDAKFQPKTRNEIKTVEWFPVNHLPTGKKDEASRTILGPNNFFMVIPFVKQLQKWIAGNSKIWSREASDRHHLRQQRLFSQVTKKDFTKYKTGDNGEKIKMESTSYSPPPRMLRQRNSKHATSTEKKKTYSNVQTDKNSTSKSVKKSEDFEKSNDAEENVILPCNAWKNFTLDREALSAIFNINMRKTFLQKN